MNTKKIKSFNLYSLVFFAFLVIILMASLERWTYYINLLYIVLVVLVVIMGKHLHISWMRALWALYLLIYPVISYHLLNDEALLTFSLPYISIILLLLLVDARLDQYKMVRIAFIGFAAFQVFGFMLQATFEGLYISIAWRLLGRWSYAVGGFTTDRTVAAFIVGVGIVATVSSLLENQSKSKSTLLQWILLAFLNLGLLLSTKRTIFVVVLLIELVMYVESSKNPTKVLKRMLLVLLAVTVLIGACVIVYNTSGASNIFGRLGYTLIGYINGEDVSSSREAGYEFMHGLWDASDNTRFFGIGWRNVQNMLGRLGHGVYREILCETGYVGLVVYIALIAMTFIHTTKNFVKLKKQGTMFQLSLIRISFYTQILFLLYSITGNAIYDSYCYLFYFMAIAINLSLSYYVRNGAVKKYGRVRSI